MDMFNKFLKRIKDITNGDKDLFVLMGLTYSCQCDCAHCGMAIYKKDKSVELKTEEWLKIINSISKKTAKGIIFFGGEPLLRADLLKLIIAAKKRGFFVAIDTNGYLLAEIFVKELKNAGLDSCEISMDSIDPETHNKFRKLDNIFQKMQEGIKNCVIEKLDFSISTCATKDKIENGELKKIIDFAREMGAIGVRVLSPVLTGKWLEEDNLRIDDIARKSLKDILDGKFAYLEEKNCSVINKKHIYISPYGEVQPCPYVPLSFGNANEESIENIISRMYKSSLYKIKSKECLMNDEKFRRGYLGDIKNSTKFPINSK